MFESVDRKRKIDFTKQVQGTPTLALGMAMVGATMTEVEGPALLVFSLGLELSEHLLGVPLIELMMTKPFL